jgi:hypothetical protein
MKKIILTFAFTLGCLTAVSAQAPGFDDDVEDVAAPIPGIALAVAAAVGIGVAKLRRNK